MNGCEKKDENHYIQDSFKEWAQFEKGTYWVYMNENTNEIDSAYIDLSGENYLYSPSYNNVHYETSRYNIRNSLGSTNTTVVLYADQDADSYLLFEGYLGHIITNSYRATANISNQITSTCRVVRRHDTLLINNQIYSNVIHTRDSSSFNDGIQYSISDYYFAKNFGLIKYSFKENSIENKWNLIRCYIVQ
jgi:hypothetical protein